MATPKGYTSQEKEDRLSAEFCTISPVGEFKHALDVSQKALTEAGTDAAEAGSTAYTIAATAHIAKKGDVIRFTSGAFDGIECNVYDVSTDTIVLGQTLPSAIGSGDTFSILTPVSLTLDASGNITTSSAPIQFVLDSVDTTVTEDTVTPSNNAPLPVKITSTSGDINITAGDLNVQTSHSGASYDSMRIGDGTEIVDVNASNEMQVADDTARTSLSTIAGDTTSLDSKITACDTDDVTITGALPSGTNNIGDVDVASSVLPTGAATETTLATVAGDTTSLDSKVTACNTGDVTIGSALPAGTNNIGDVDIASSALPTGAATEATLATVAGDTTSLDSKVTACNTGDVTVSSSALPTGAATESTLSTLDGKVTACNTEAVVVSSSALPAGAATESTLSTLSGNVTACDTDDVTISGVSGKSSVDLIRNDYGSTPVSTIGYVQLIASTSGTINMLDIFDSSGQTLVLATGASLSEVDVLYITPGGNGQVPLTIASGTRLSVKAVSGVADEGELTITALS